MEVAVVFKEEEFLVYDCKKENWQLGDFNDANVYVPQNASVLVVDPTIH